MSTTRLLPQLQLLSDCWLFSSAFKALITNFFTTLERPRFFLNKQHTVIRGFHLPSRRSCAKYHLFGEKEAPANLKLSRSLSLDLAPSPPSPAAWSGGAARGPARPDSCSTRRHRCSDRLGGRCSSSRAPSLCRLPFPHLPSCPPPTFFHFDPTTLSPGSTRRHGRQAATRTGDRKQLINMVTPLHLPGPTWGGELSASKTKQPSTHTHYPNTHTIRPASGSAAHKICHSQNAETCRYKIFTQRATEAAT